MTTTERAELDAVIARTLQDRGLAYQHPGEGQFVVALPGTHRLSTACWLVVGDHALLVEAFVMRHADESREQLYDFLLQRNSRMYGVAFCLDQQGDVYLVGRLPLSAVTPDELDRLLGSVLTYADENFDTMLRIGFGSSIRREWAWRVKRGESLANLAAFARFADPAAAGSGPGGVGPDGAGQGDAQPCGVEPGGAQPGGAQPGGAEQGRTDPGAPGRQDPPGR